MKPDQQPSLNKAFGTCVEIGTWDGGFTLPLLEKSQVTKVYCVDPYKHFLNEEYPDGMNSLTQEEFDKKFKNVKDLLTSKFTDKVNFLRMLSKEASFLFEDKSVDFVYIDGNHDYKFVLEDLKLWYPKIRPGGFLCGDDIVSMNLSEHDKDGNVTRIWGHGCWGKYGTYKALVDFGKPFQIVGTQFIIRI